MSRPQVVVPVRLHGALGARFGAEHRLAVRTPAEAVRALTVLRPGFRQAIAAGNWQVVRGDLAAGAALGADELGMRLGPAGLHIVPVTAGAHGGLGKIIGGLALAAGAFFLGPASLGLIGTTVARAGIGIGISMALNGSSALLAPKPKASKAAGADNSSLLFNAPENVSVQGGAVPIGFGRFRVGSVVISAGLEAEAAPAT